MPTRPSTAKPKNSWHQTQSHDMHNEQMHTERRYLKTMLSGAFLCKSLCLNATCLKSWFVTVFLIVGHTVEAVFWKSVNHIRPCLKWHNLDLWTSSDSVLRWCDVVQTLGLNDNGKIWHCDISFCCDTNTISPDEYITALFGKMSFI